MFDGLDGVVRTSVGYTSGANPDPNYNTVCAGDGHTEAVRIEYDPESITYTDLLETYWSSFIGPGSKRQYRSAIWYRSEEQRDEALRSLQEVRESGRFDSWMVGPQAISIEPECSWHDAEPSHQHYLTGGRGKGT